MMENKLKKKIAQNAQLVPATLKMRVSKSGPRVVGNQAAAVVKPPTGAKKTLEYTMSAANIQKRKPEPPLAKVQSKRTLKTNPSL